MKTGTNADTAILLKNPEFQKRLINLYDNKCAGWKEVREKIEEEFGQKISLSALKNCYNTCIAKSITISGPEKNYLEGAAENMGKRLDVIMSITDEMAIELKKALNKIRENEKLDSQKKIAMTMALINYNDKLTNSFIKQLNFVASQLKQITIKKNEIQWDETKLYEEIQKSVPSLLSMLEEENKIAVIDRSLLEN